MHVLLTQDHIDAFQRDGVVLIKGLFADHVETLRAGIDRNMSEPGIMPRKTSKASGTVL